MAIQMWIPPQRSMQLPRRLARIIPRHPYIRMRWGRLNSLGCMVPWKSRWTTFQWHYQKDRWDRHYFRARDLHVWRYQTFLQTRPIWRRSRSPPRLETPCLNVRRTNLRWEPPTSTRGPRWVPIRLPIRYDVRLEMCNMSFRHLRRCQLTLDDGLTRHNERFHRPKIYILDRLSLRFSKTITKSNKIYSEILRILSIYAG